MKNKLRLALFISGGGTTACAIIKACREGKLSIDPVLVIASRKDISGIKRVQDAVLDKKYVLVIDPKNFNSQTEFAERLIYECQKQNVDLVGQYGWLPLTPKKFVEVYKEKIINQHPGPLDPPRPDFGGNGMYGRRVHAAILYFRRITKRDYWTEATTHFVTSEFDKGDVIKRRKIKILPKDTVGDLQKRVLFVEHEVQIEALNDFVEGKVRVLDRSNQLIRKDEINILSKAKETAKILYPTG